MKQSFKGNAHSNSYFSYLFTLLLLQISWITPLIPQRLDERLISQDEILKLIRESQEEEGNCQLSDEDFVEIRSVNPKKPWTIIIYMAADNDLHYFAWKNLKQMEQIGSNGNINIIVQLNTPGYLNPTKRFIVKKDRRLLVQEDKTPLQKLNSGSPYTLIDCVKWAVEHYPADEYALFLWNHGSAAIDPNFARTTNPCDLFFLNPTDNKLEIDRGVSYIALLSQVISPRTIANDENRRGICFDDTFKSYISNPELDFALREICTKVLNNKKFGLIAFDACLMSMIEIASIVRHYAKYMASSEEVEYGTGLDYKLTLAPFLQKNLSPKDFARQVVVAYEQAYRTLSNDYTYSALDLSICDQLEQNINNVAKSLHTALTYQQGHTVTDILRKCKASQYCTVFDEPTYIDIGDFYLNLQQHIAMFKLIDKSKEVDIQNELRNLLKQGLDIIHTLVIENRVGPKLAKAQGISIYFPEQAIAYNYFKSPFALSNNWSYLLSKYILG